jgi:hypothetical protein
MTRRPTMLRKVGWAAFLASSTSLLTFAAAQADAARPTYACFSPDNAAVIGKLGAADPSVRYGFESGECLALSPGVPISNVERVGNLWRFRAFGAEPYLYAADWAAGFAPATGNGQPGFEGYLPVTARLMALGREQGECFAASDRLNRWGDDLDRRWHAYQARSRTDVEGPSPVIVLHVADTGPKLFAEIERYKREEAMLRRRCSAVISLEADTDFIVFARTAQYA